MIGADDSAGEALSGAVNELLSGDLTALSSAELYEVFAQVEVQRRRLAAVDVRLLAEVRDRGVARDRCRPSVADLLVSEFQVAPGEARARVLAAQELGGRRALTGQTLEPVLPRAAAALASGEISAAHVSVIGRAIDRVPADIAAEAGPVVEQLLVEAARHEHPKELERTARLCLTRLDPDGAEPCERNSTPSFTVSPHESGWSTARGSLDPATTAAVLAVLDSLSAPAPAADDCPDPRSAAHRRHDALREACDRLIAAGDLPASGGVPVTIVLSAPAEQWIDPEADRDDGYAPRRPALNGLALGPHGEIWRIRDLLPCGDPGCGTEIITLTEGTDGAQLSLGRTRRLASRSQRLALAHRDRGCSFPGCSRPSAWAEAHHIIAWQDGGATDLANLTLLCGFHHREFGRRGWSVRMAGDGLPEWTPPNWIDPERKPRRNRAHHDDKVTLVPPRSPSRQR